MANITVAVFFPGKAEPQVAIISNTLKAMQEIVGGMVEVVRFKAGRKRFELWCNENGIAEDRPYNREVAGHEIMGTFFVAGVAKGEAPTSLTPEDVRVLTDAIGKAARVSA